MSPPRYAPRHARASKTRLLLFAFSSKPWLSLLRDHFYSIKSVQGFYMRLPFQLATPPGLHAIHIPNGNLVYMKKMYFLLFKHAVLRRPRVPSRTFGCGASQGAVGTLRRMSGSQPSTAAVLGALNIAELALRNKGLLSASPSRVGDIENPIFDSLFFSYIACRPLLYVCFQPQQKKQQKQQQHTAATVQHLSAVVSVAPSPLRGCVHLPPSTFVTTKLSSSVRIVIPSKLSSRTLSAAGNRNGQEQQSQAHTASRLAVLCLSMAPNTTHTARLAS